LPPMADSGEELRMNGAQISVCARLMVRTNSYSSITGTVQATLSDSAGGDPDAGRLS
jgi:hypothetical protein